MRFGRKSGKEERTEAASPPPSRPPTEATAERPPTFLPRREARPRIESVFVRVVATAGIVGIATVIGAIMASQDLEGWIIAVAVSAVSVVLAAILWSSRSL